MTCFTFDTAYIVASMQNTCNEAVKTAIRRRLAEGTPWRWNHSNFECFCYAWKYDILDTDPPLARPAVDPHPAIG